MSEPDNPSARGNEADGVAVDELHLTLRIPNDLPEDEVEAIRRVLAGGDFLDRLHWAVLAAVRTIPELSAVRVSLAR